MDLAQMLVVGGCAVIGASLGVTFWRVSQSSIFQRLVSKKKKADENVAEADEDVTIEDAEIVEEDDGDDLDSGEILDGDELEFVDENQVDDDDLLDEPADEKALDPNVQDDEDAPLREAEFDVSLDLDAIDDAPLETNEIIEEIPTASDEVESRDLLAQTLEFQEKTAQALGNIAERLGDALVRLERLENSVESQISGNSADQGGTESGLLDEHIEISELPIAPAPSESEANEAAQEPEEDFEEEAFDEDFALSQDADIEQDQMETQVDSVEVGVEEIDDPPDEAIEIAQVEEPGPKVEDEHAEQAAKAEDPLDLPRVIGI